MTNATYAAEQKRNSMVLPLVALAVVVFLAGILIGARLGVGAKKATQENHSTKADALSITTGESSGVKLLASAPATTRGAVQAATGFVTAIPQILKMTPDAASKAISNAVYLDPSSQALDKLNQSVANGRQTLSTLSRFEVVPVFYKAPATVDLNKGTEVQIAVINVIIDQGKKHADSSWAIYNVQMKRQFGSWKVVDWSAQPGPFPPDANPNTTDAIAIETMAQQLDGYVRFGNAPSP
jgi:hypothetical protein